MVFNEDTRVKYPTILHLCRLRDKYLPLKVANWNIEANILQKELNGVATDIKNFQMLCKIHNRAKGIR
jgi:type I restriction enzyme R subunit